MYFFHINQFDLTPYAKNWRLFLVWGVALMALGIIAISASTLTTLISIAFLGVLILLSGVVIVIDSITFWWGRGSGFFLHFLMGLLCCLVAILLIKNPLLATVSLTLLLGIFYLTLGILRVIYSLYLRTPQWGWYLFNGFVTLLLGTLILMSWPASSLFIIGLFVGIDLFFSGWAYIIAALTVRTFVKNS